MRIVAIDPSSAVKGPGCACALFENAELCGVWFARSGTAYTRAPKLLFARAPDVVVLEVPEMRSHDRKDPNTLIGLGVEGALVAGQYGVAAKFNFVLLTPTQWKGSRKKPQHHGLIWAALSDAERVWLPSETPERIKLAKHKGAREAWRRPGAEYYGAWTGHNLLDAVGLGLFHLQRIER